MAEGQLRCVGSSLFLKRKFGVGYQLTIIKNSNRVEEEAEKEEEPSTQAEESKEDRYCVEMDLNGIIEGIVKGAVPSAAVLSNVGTEMKFQLPIGESARFVGMFKMLDKQTEKHRIESYGVSVTTLDEVFLLVTRGDLGLHTSSETKKETTVNKETSEVVPLSKIGECSRFKRHVQALFAKRAKNFKRDKKAW
jgi:ATP-binding cassette subfamily A (ABC1) protein 3